ncbi:MAG: hypothetical protein U0165_16760 [Polyangiaceae bacterium]
MPNTLPRLTAPQVDVLEKRYRLEMARYEKTAAAVADRLRRELRAEARVRHLLTFRAKHPEGLREKLLRKARDPRASSYTFEALSHNLNEVVTDLAGCRVIVYDPEDEPRVVSVVDRTFSPAKRSDAQPAPVLKPNGYRATHRLVVAPDTPDDLSIRGAICEIQITTLAAHLYNELEHDIAYKEDRGEHTTTTEHALLRELLGASLISDRLVKLLIAEHLASTRKRASLQNAEELRFALERLAGRPLQGDFARLFRLLSASIEPLSTEALESLGGVLDIIAQGEQIASDLSASRGINLTGIEPVTAYTLGLFPKFSTEFAVHAMSWRGPQTPIQIALIEASRQVKVEGLKPPESSAFRGFQGALT